jgi:DNA-binding Xre family transcriptional regulator
MRFSCNKLFKLLIDRNIKKKELREMSGVSATSIAKLGKGVNVNTDVLLKICGALNCDIGDIMEFVPDNERSEKIIR